MKIAIMQPYFFPYIGYWQLINAVDKYVIYDDGLFRPRGWINRNRILINNQSYYITIPLHQTISQEIRNMPIINNYDFRRKMKRDIFYAYKKAPCFERAMGVIEPIIDYDTDNCSDYIVNSIYKICDYLKITTSIEVSSRIDKERNKGAIGVILSVCKYFGADCYVNAIGGMGLYNKESFHDVGIELKFLSTEEIQYRQFGKEFHPNLSIIDVMMFNTKEEIIGMLSKYELIGPGGKET